MSVIAYDKQQRRVYLLGQRCHHGATGIFCFIIGCIITAYGSKTPHL